MESKNYKHGYVRVRQKLDGQVSYSSSSNFSSNVVKPAFMLSKVHVSIQKLVVSFKMFIYIFYEKTANLDAELGRKKAF